MNRPAAILLFAILPAAVAFGLYLSRRASPPAPPPIPPAEHRRLASNVPYTVSHDVVAEVLRIEAREKKVAETLWSTELLAQECGRTIEALWDELNRTTNKWNVLSGFNFGELHLPGFDPPEKLPHGIELRRPNASQRTLASTDWPAFLAQFQKAGWQLAQAEFRHNRFETNTAGRPARSEYFFSAHLTNHFQPQRAIVEGPLVLHWSGQRALDSARVERIDATGVVTKFIQGPAPFTPILSERISLPKNSRNIDPLVVYDLDSDGFSELNLCARNVVYRRTPGQTYRPEPLFSFEPGFLSTALVSDFDGDRFADVLFARYEGVFLVSGSKRGTFDNPPRLAWSIKHGISDPMVMTCGDIDRDGDLDLFLAQYREPYDQGGIPTPFFDANDGFPAFLLINDGAGGFSNRTAESNLAPKRARRTYSASFVHLDADPFLDLAVVSDFAGLDLYKGSGNGRFQDITSTFAGETHAFGMAHAFADFNSDGQLDLLMTGMTSPTVERLDHLQLSRPPEKNSLALRTRMTHGSRLYMGKPGGGFGETSLGNSIARSGWSWGCAAFDFDNDGFQEVYIANGLESNQSVRDYEGEYWLHDRFVSDSTGSQAADLYYGAKFSRTRGRDYSYGGYDKNRFYLNLQGSNFVETAHLFGVALEQDSRNVVATDLDLDGRVDLVVTTLEIWPEPKQTLKIYKNILSAPANWIGFLFSEQDSPAPPVGTRVVIHYNGRSAIRQLVTGDSYRSQHPLAVHFGLGTATQVDSAEIRWPDGKVTRLQIPELNKYHVPQSK